VRLAEVTFGKLDIMIANAGVGGAATGKRIEDVTDEDWSQVIDVNLAGGVALLQVRRFPPIRRAGGGSMSATSSIAGLHTMGRIAQRHLPRHRRREFCSLTSFMAVELAPDLIRVNSVCPGGMATNIIENTGGPKTAAQLASVFMKRWKGGHPSEPSAPPTFLPAIQREVARRASVPELRPCVVHQPVNQSRLDGGRGSAHVGLRVGQTGRMFAHQAQAHRTPSLPEILEEIFLPGRHSIVVSGTHGKTTTTAMLAWIFSQRGTAAEFFSGRRGGKLRKRVYGLGGGAEFILEGDEYETAFWDRGPKFFHYHPDDLVITFSGVRSCGYLCGFRDV